MKKTIIFKEHFESNRDIFNTARIIIKETPKTYVSYSQRERITNKNDKNYDLFQFPTNHGKFSFKKDTKYPLIKNKDGVKSTITKTETPEEIKSAFQNELTYSEIFDLPLNHLFEKDSYILQNLSFYNDMLDIGKCNFDTDGFDKSSRIFFNKSPKDNDIQFSTEIIEYLENLFSVKKVFKLNYFTFTSFNQKDILSKTATLLHINHLTKKDEKFITIEENDKNISLLFWLFKDVLVISEQNILGTW